MSTSQPDHAIDRRQFLAKAGTAGAGVLVGASALGALAPGEGP